MNQDNAPKFTHDCDTCKFLGHVEGHDLYFHASERPGGFGETVIARASCEPSDYQSGMFASFGSIPLLTRARLLAQEAGLLQYPLLESLYSRPISMSPELLSELKQNWSPRPEYELVNALASGTASQELFEKAFLAHAQLRALDVTTDEQITRAAESLTNCVRTLAELLEVPFKPAAPAADQYWQTAQAFEETKGWNYVF